MAVLRSGGIEMDLPPGWEGRMHRRQREPGATRAATAEPDGELMTAHASNFPLPVELGDFGGGAVEGMRPRDLYVCLFEYGPESVGEALFQQQGMPRSLRHHEFDPQTLRTPLPGLSGLQRFFTVAGRAFCLYVVLGSHARRYRTTPAVNEVLSATRIT